ncbi:MAG: hypothetical protein ACK4TA_10355 [Saprospiraceae bacterium]
MKNKALASKSAKTIAAIAALVFFSSCNRGYGCPTNFSIDFVDVLKAAVEIFF